MRLRFQNNYVGWLKPKVITLKTQPHAVNACRNAAQMLYKIEHTFSIRSVFRIALYFQKAFKKVRFENVKQHEK